MDELFERFVNLSIQSYEIKYIDKQCDKYFKIKAKLEGQRCFVNELIDRYKKKYGIDLHTLEEGGGEND